MRQKNVLVTAVALGLLAVSVAAQSPVRTVKDGVLDKIDLFVEKPPAATKVAIRHFSITDADLTEGEKYTDETKRMQSDAPPMMAEKIQSELKKYGAFADVTILADGAKAPAGALLIEGKFIEMDPGSRAKRYFVGFGAGKSGVTVQGTVKGPDGAQLATFQQRRIGAMNSYSDSIEMLRDDTRSIGEDIAKFMTKWSKGEKLK